MLDRGSTHTQNEPKPPEVRQHLLYLLHPPRRRACVVTEPRFQNRKHCPRMVGKDRHWSPQVWAVASAVATACCEGLPAVPDRLRGREPIGTALPGSCADNVRSPVRALAASGRSTPKAGRNCLRKPVDRVRRCCRIETASVR